MTLPIFHTEVQEFSLMQTKWSSEINPVLDLPTNRGIILKQISLVTGSTNQVNHLLGRNLQGWFLTRQRSTAIVYDSQDSNTMPNLTLNLVTSANVTVDIFVF